MAKKMNAAMRRMFLIDVSRNSSKRGDSNLASRVKQFGATQTQNAVDIGREIECLSCVAQTTDLKVISLSAYEWTTANKHPRGSRGGCHTEEGSRLRPAHARHSQRHPYQVFVSSARNQSAACER